MNIFRIFSFRNIANKLCKRFLLIYVHTLCCSVRHVDETGLDYYLMIRLYKLWVFISLII